MVGYLYLRTREQIHCCNMTIISSLGEACKSTFVCKLSDSINMNRWTDDQGGIIIICVHGGPLDSFQWARDQTYSNNWEVFNRVFRFCFSAHSRPPRFRPFVTFGFHQLQLPFHSIAVCSQIIISKYGTRCQTTRLAIRIRIGIHIHIQIQV